MPILTKKAWFGPKRYLGWGWTPASWEGWLVTLVYVVILIAAGAFNKARPENFTATLIVTTAVFIAVIILTGDKPGGPGLKLK